MLGGHSAPKEPNDKCREAAQKARPDIEAKINKKFNTFEVVQFTSQVVNGTNYNMKIKVDGDTYIHAKFYQALPTKGGAIEVKEVTEGHTLQDELK